MRLVAEGVGFSYVGAAASVLANVSLEVAPGSSVAIVGPSGSGKTTFLSLLGGLLQIQRGAIWCEDAAGNRHQPRDVTTWVLQTVSLLPHRTVIDNVCLGAYLDSAPHLEARDRAYTALASMGLADRAHDEARVLSGGEAQRVAIARSLASNRPLLLADEPTGQLDASTSTTVLDALFAASGRTLILVTHDEAAAARCDRVLRLRDGDVEPRSRSLEHS